MATITVRGTGTALGTPDEATVGLGSESLRPTAADALAIVAEQPATLVALCGELGLPAGSVTTTGISVREQADHDRDGRTHHRGYRASQRVSVRVADPAVVGRLLPEHAAHAEACRAAAADARRRAEALAEALGGRLGTVISVRDSRIAPPEPRFARQIAATDAPGDPLPVEAGELSVVAQVDVEFGLEQG